MYFPSNSSLRRLISNTFIGIALLIGNIGLNTENLFAEDAAPAPSTIEPTTVAAIVNGHEIHVSEIDQVMKQKPAYAPYFASGKVNPDVLANIRLRVLQSMIDRDLLLDATKKSSVVNEEDVKKLSDSVVDRYGGAEKLTQMLQASGMTFDGFLEDLKNDLRMSQYLDKSLMKDVRATNEELKKAFDQSAQKYTERESIKARHILIKVARGATPEQEKIAKDKIDQLYSEATKPNADFGAVAKASSECPSAPQGGDLGYFSKGTMVPEFERAAFALKQGEISQPVRTEFGFHIIKLEDKKEASKPDYEKARTQVEKDVINQKKAEKVEAYVKELRKGASIDVKLHAS